ncbi:MAG: signal peptidase II [Gammaproteobacteria bacterium]|nr:signal peptidase II [Gammaproteobacteria bacterium]
MNLIKRVIVIFLVSLACAGCDQGTKSLASTYLPKNEMFSYFYDTVRIGYVENSGAFLGFGGLWSESLRFLLFTVLAALFLVSLFIYLALNSKLSLSTVAGFSLILGGGSSGVFQDSCHRFFHAA